MMIEDDRQEAQLWQETMKIEENYTSLKNEFLNKLTRYEYKWDAHLEE